MAKDVEQPNLDFEELRRAVSVIAPSGRESEALAVIGDMIESRPGLIMSRDSFGNIIVRHKKEVSGSPLFFSAHIDHPALVVTAIRDDDVCAEYRGGSETNFHVGASVLIATQTGDLTLTILGIEKSEATSPLLRLTKQSQVRIGDVGTITSARDCFACDDMVGVCALIHAIDRTDDRHLSSPIRLVLTRAEEIGMIGAIGACRAGVIPPGSRIIVVDARNEKDSHKILVSIRDRSGPVSPRLAMECVGHGCEVDERFVSATEAGVYGTFGFESVAVTYPIGHMHNTDGQTTSCEKIDKAVYIRLVEVITRMMNRLSRDSARATLTKHFERNYPLISD